MSNPTEKYVMFRNRLQKVFRHLSKQAARQNITCYRIYDHDLPEFPFVIEFYEDRLHVAEYRRNHQLSEEEHNQWLQQCKSVMADVLSVQEVDIFMKLRKRKEDRLDQYQKLDETKNEFVVIENGLKFIVNLSDYLDTGLFLDHRITRNMVRERAANKNVLNLFCYTGSFSVYAAAGGSKEIISVDLSKTYLSWAERNMKLNGFDSSNFQFVHADVKQYLKKLSPERFDLIIMDPPTFSNSKRMNDILDIQQDHVTLINDCLRTLKTGGELFFSTNYRSFKLNADAINSSNIKNITRATTPFDFAGKLQRQCYLYDK
jgi:23S rRNA (cytosine1962-C5)-methyltransferase